MADWSDIQFNAGQTDYVGRLNTLLTRAESFATEVENGRGGLGSLALQINTRLTEAQVDVRVNALALTYSAGLAADFNCNNRRLRSMADPLLPQDGATRAWVLSQLTIGGDPTGVPVTSLNVGTMGDGQFLRRSGTTLQGIAQVAIPVTGFAVGGLQDGEFLARQGTNLVGRRISSARPYFFASF